VRGNSLGKVDGKRLSIYLTGLRQLLWLLWFDENNEGLDALKDGLPDEIRWINKSIMLVDVLTKDMNSNDMRRIMKDSMEHWGHSRIISHKDGKTEISQARGKAAAERSRTGRSGRRTHESQTGSVSHDQNYRCKCIQKGRSVVIHGAHGT